MKKIAFLTILIFIIGIMFSCNDSSSGDDVAVGYIDPVLGTPKDIIPKSYAFDVATINESCSLGTTCNAIIYQGTLTKPYTGIAINNNSGFYFKMYWEGSSMPEASSTITVSATAEKIILKKTAILEQSATSVPFNITIENEDNGTYTVTFITSDITVGSQTIKVGDSIRAYKY